MMALAYLKFNCTESLFGYRHEKFKQKELLKVGETVDQLTDDRFNMKNPACLVFLMRTIVFRVIILGQIKKKSF
ncbi:MAG: hypothetical protein Ct9H300mP4_14620 [Gammaproteobacteria bacterium]|nr:MAG: hypothetical protein Ct9H300mP4_14620 [Gammaproteobacteria bacterium]